jgi:hypothetical protein
VTRTILTIHNIASPRITNARRDATTLGRSAAKENSRIILHRGKSDEDFGIGRNGRAIATNG